MAGHGPARGRPPGRVRPHSGGVCACRTGRSSGGGPTAVLLGRRRLLPHTTPSPPAPGRRERHGSHRPIRPARLRRQPVFPGGREVVRIPGGGVPAAGEARSGGRCRGWEQLWRGGSCGQNPKSSVQNAAFPIAVVLLRFALASLAAFYSCAIFTASLVAIYKISMRVLLAWVNLNPYCRSRYTTCTRPLDDGKSCSDMNPRLVPRTKEGEKLVFARHLVLVLKKFFVPSRFRAPKA